jgi:hypothetical protein
MMNILNGRMRVRLGICLAFFLSLLWASAALAQAQLHTIKLKVSGVEASCAIGSFSFDKSGVAAGSSGTTNTATVTVTGPNCAVGLNAGTYTGTLTVYVNNVVVQKGTPSAPLDQGKNVTAISGTLTGTGGRTITFQGTSTDNTTQYAVVGPTSAFQPGGGPSGTTTPGSYYVYASATVNGTPVPEPSMLWLVSAALGAMWLVRRRPGRSA